MLITNSEIWFLILLLLGSNGVTAIVARLIIRRKQSADLVATLKQELRDLRRIANKREAIHEHKLAVYRNAAIKVRVMELYEEASKPRLIVRR